MGEIQEEKVMTVEEFYNLTGGDYKEIMGRLKTETRIVKFAGMFLRDGSYDMLAKCLEDGNADEGFRAAHTMKGMCQNMAFTRLYTSVHEVTETLRTKDLDKAKEIFVRLTEDYNAVIDGINKLLAEQP